MKVYAIHTGCRFEGGGVKEIFAEKDNAIKFALMEVEENNKQAVRIHESDEFVFKEVPKDEYSIDGIDSGVVKMWQSPIDEIIIYEYEVK